MDFACGVFSLDALVALAGLGGFVGRGDFGVGKSARQHAVVIGVGQFMQRKIGHAPGLGFEVRDVGEFDAVHHGGVAAVVAQPSRTRMILGPSALARVGAGEPEGDLAQGLDGRRGDDLNDFTQLDRQQFQGFVGGGALFGPQSGVDPDGPAFDLSDHAFGIRNLRFGGGFCQELNTRQQGRGDQQASDPSTA